VGNQTSRARAVNPFNEQTNDRYFVGRETELETFQWRLKSLAAGEPSHAFVAGVHGTGKSFFLDKVVNLAVQHGFIGVLTSLDEGASAHASIHKTLRATVAKVEKDTKNSSGLLVDWDSGQNSTYFRQPKLAEPDSDAIQDDLQQLCQIASGCGSKGIVISIDEGQRLAPAALSALKNALARVSGVMVVLSLRLVTAEGGARKAGRTLLDEIANRAEGDIGASSIFGTQFGMGPFATDEEAHRCMSKRLENNIVSFDPQVIQGIGELSGRVPRRIIEYASRAWDMAAGDSAHENVATADVLAVVFKDMHPNEADRALSLVSNLSGLKRKVLSALLALDARATLEQLATRVHTEDGGDLEVLERAVEGELSDLVEQFRGISRMSEGQNSFEIPNAVDTFALSLALEER